MLLGINNEIIDSEMHILVPNIKNVQTKKQIKYGYFNKKYIFAP